MLPWFLSYGGQIISIRVQYDSGLTLSLHTMIKGRNSLQPWRFVKQVAKANNIPTVEELVRVVPPQLTEDALLQVSQKLVTQQEKENNPQLGLYRYEGVVLNVETQSRGCTITLHAYLLE